MPLQKKDIEHIAKLAKLKYSDNEIEELLPQVNKVLDYMEKLNELNTDNVEPLSHPLEGSNVFREDIPGQSLSTEEALKNAPKKDDKYYKVPKVINAD